MMRVFQLAIKEQHNTGSTMLREEHLFLGFLQEKTGALGEVALRVTIDEEGLRNLVTNRQDEGVVYYAPLHATIDENLLAVIETAKKYMKHYNQNIINEGHILRALLSTSVINEYVTEGQKDMFIDLGTTARDMITHLGGYEFPSNLFKQIRKAKISDKDNLLRFIEEEFSKEWMNTIRSAFENQEQHSIYIALDNKGNIIGFAGYDVFERKKGYFDPMGVAKSNRIKGVGYSLLHHCLNDMKEIGYEYAIIGGAGPIEFYEKSCQAVVIPRA